VNEQVNIELVINDLLEQNKQLTLQVAMLRAALSQYQAAESEPNPPAADIVADSDEL
jgi:regulator of replication initiation timing